MPVHIIDAKSKATGPDYGGHLASTPVKGSVQIIKTTLEGEKKSQSTVLDKETTLASPILTNPQSMTVGGSRTLNLGNYEAAKIYVSLTVPFTEGEIEGTYSYASEWVSQKIQEAITLATKD